MEDIYLAEHLLKTIRERRESVVERLSMGGVRNMEDYRALVGSIESLDYISAELKQILDKSM
tara:strand:+ start:523 stop:708 length:186 start_codon:yes stop_codon:yes gene_type:complete